MKKLLFTLYSLFLVNILYSQDIAASEQAQGYLNSKNISVDHATGIFHYSVPLFELHSGDFVLPITLNYTAKGVKTEDKPGLVGYNWNLQTGGIVTRTLRGGVPDEKASLAYYMYTDVSDIDYESINKHKTDGEADIFTAIFNGRTVHFIIVDSEIHPLEHTDVSISYRKKNGEISGFTVVDENGIQYIYDVQERMLNLYHQEPISFNDIQNKVYPTSWYLSEIKLPQAESIQFEYERENNILVADSVAYLHSVFMNYEYGKPMKELEIDFEKCRAEFKECIYLAKQAAWDLFNKELVDASFASSISSLETAWNLQNSLRQQYQLLGVITDFEKVSGATARVYAALKELISIYSNTEVATWLGAARGALRRSWEIKEIEKKTFDTRTGYTISSPILKKIKCQDRILQFIYEKRDGRYEGKRLIQAQLSSMNRYELQSVFLSFNSYDLLKKIDIYGPYCPDSYSFFYLNEDSPLGKKSENMPEPATEKYILKKIITSLGKKVQLEYERLISDTSLRKILTRNYLKSITISNGAKTDSIKYKYPQRICVFDNMYYGNVLDYGSFSDKVRKTEWEYVGSACVNTGNDGIFFPYVEEEWVGKGKCSYLFFVPKPPKLNNTPFQESFFLYSLCGLPLGKAVYNQAGNLVQLEKYKYQTNIELSDYADSDNWFEYSDDTSVASVLQIKDNPYYMNEDEIRTHYGNQKRIFLSDIASLNPIEFYYSNYEPRTSPINISNEVYRLLYNTKVVLKNNKVLKFEGTICDQPSPDHFTKDWSSYRVAKDVGYRYNHLSYRAYPEQIITHLSNGDEMLQLIKRPLNFLSGADPVIDRMKENHLFSAVVKQQLLLKKKGETVYHLLSEEVNKYQDSVLQNGEKKFFCVASYDWANREKQLDLDNTQENRLFTDDFKQYRVLSAREYKKQRESFVPFKERSLSDTALFFYEPYRNNVILTVKGDHSEGVAIFDNYSEKEIHDYFQEIQPYLNVYPDIITFLNADSLKFKHGFYPQVFQYFRTSEDYKFCLNAAKIFASLPEYSVFLSLVKEIENFEPLEDPFYKVDLQYDLMSDMDKCLPREIFDQMAGAVQQFYFIGRDRYEFFRRVLNSEIIEPDSTNSISITGQHINRLLNVVFLLSPKETTLPVEYIIKQGNNQTVKQDEVNGLTPGRYQLAKFNIDLSAYEGPLSLTVKLPTGRILRTALIIPEGLEYEGKSYDKSSRVIYKFNQLDELESYEYEVHDQLRAIFDKDGHLIMEKQYKFSN